MQKNPQYAETLGVRKGGHDEALKCVMPLGMLSRFNPILILGKMDMVFLDVI